MEDFVKNDPTLEYAQQAVDQIRQDMGEGPVRVTRALFITEVMTDEGERYLFTIQDRESRSWERLGMLHAAIQDELADVILERNPGEED